MRANGFSCSLGLLYRSLGISNLQFLINKIEIEISRYNFFSVLGHETLDPDPQFEKMPDPNLYPGPHYMNVDPKPWFII
jgi:hypothetical protein